MHHTSTWAVVDDTPAPVSNEAYADTAAAAAAAANNYQWDAHKSDEDIRKMWHFAALKLVQQCYLWSDL